MIAVIFTSKVRQMIFAPSHTSPAQTMKPNDCHREHTHRIHSTTEQSIALHQSRSWEIVQQSISGTIIRLAMFLSLFASIFMFWAFKLLGHFAYGYCCWSFLFHLFYTSNVFTLPLSFHIRYFTSAISTWHGYIVHLRRRRFNLIIFHLKACKLTFRSTHNQTIHAHAKTH